ncbi:patatin-like phospholipase [Aureococcus anophagefferens]|nr:patatin-like phospholipase [Aureococcus anophagefferens]
MYRFAWFRGFEASDADTQTSSGRGAAPSPFKRWFGEAAVANHTSLAETVSALTTELLNGFRNEDSDEVEYKSVTYNPIDLGKRLVTEYGLFKGQRLEEHIEALLFQATGVAHVTFRQLRELRPDVALRLTATSITHQRVTYFDVVATPDLAIARAVRASSAVPLLFAPVEIDGELFVDGGLLKNLPYDAFDLEGHPTLALSIRTPTAAELQSKDDDRKLALPTFSTFFAALLETLTFGEGSANCLSHALVRDGLDLVELGVYEYGAAGLGFDVTRADKLKMIEAAHDAVRVHLEAAERDGGLFEDRRPWEPRDPLDLDDDRDDAT